MHRRNMVTSPEKMVTFADDTILEAALGGELYECSAFERGIAVEPDLETVPEVLTIHGGMRVATSF